MPDQLVNVKDPDTGEIGSLPASQAQEALAQGYTPASAEEVGQYFKEQKYGSGMQQAAAGLEGAASGLTFGLSTGAERLLGVPAEDIRARREINPGTHMAGELAGLGIGSLYGAGEAAALEKAGAMVAGKIAGETALSKVGGMAARLATENAMYQGGDEVSKYFSSDPNQTIGAAMADVGLAGLFGAATGAGIGAVSPLWKATVGKQVESALNAMKNKAGGIDGLTSQPVAEALDKSGISFPPEIRAALSDDPQLQNVAKTLEQSDTTKSGMAYQQTLTQAKQDLSNVALGAIGRDAAQVEKLGDLSKYEAGKAVGDALANEVHTIVDPLAKEFEALKGKVGNVELPADTILETPKTVVDPQNLMGVPRVEIEKTRVPGVMSQAADKISEMALKEGWLAAEDTPVANLVGFVQKNLNKQKSLKDLGNFISRVGEKAESLSSLTDRSASRAGAMVKGILKDVEAGVIEKSLGEHGAELVDRFKSVRGAWREASKLTDALEEQIGVRASTSGYAKAIREMAQQDGEALLRRIAGSGNASGLKLLQERFPQAAEVFKAYHVDALAKAGAKSAKAGEVINPKALIREVGKLSPEMRAFLVSPEAASKLSAVDVLMSQLEKAPHNFSNTARTLDKLNSHVAGGAVAIAGALTGHPVAGAILAPLMKVLSKDAPDAVRLSALKFIGSNQAVDSAGFKAMTDVARAVYRGEQVMGKAVRQLLRGGSKIAGKRDVSENDIKKLDKQLLAIRQNPEAMLGVGGDVGHYLPDHATKMVEVAGGAANYLNSLRPGEDKAMPLDHALPPDPVKVAKFERALRIAADPISVMEDVKDGSVTPADLETLHNVAPGFYASMRQKVMDEVVNYKSEGEDIPYRTRLGLALFLGQPLDSTMTPQAIQMAQPMNPAPPPQMAQGGPKPTASGMQKLSKLGPSVATGTQAREMGRAKHLA